LEDDILFANPAGINIPPPAHRANSHRHQHHQTRVDDNDDILLMGTPRSFRSSRRRRSNKIAALALVGSVLMLAGFLVLATHQHAPVEANLLSQPTFTPFQLNLKVSDYALLWARIYRPSADEVEITGFDHRVQECLLLPSPN